MKPHNAIPAIFEKMHQSRLIDATKPVCIHTTNNLNSIRTLSEQYQKIMVQNAEGNTYAEKMQSHTSLMGWEENSCYCGHPEGGASILECILKCLSTSSRTSLLRAEPCGMSCTMMLNPLMRQWGESARHDWEICVCSSS